MKMAYVYMHCIIRLQGERLCTAKLNRNEVYAVYANSLVIFLINDFIRFYATSQQAPMIPRDDLLAVCHCRSLFVSFQLLKFSFFFQH